MSKIWTLTKNDYVKGIAVAIITAVLTLVLQTLQNGLVINWQEVLTVALTAGIGYILKNLATDENGKLGGVI